MATAMAMIIMILMSPFFICFLLVMPVVPVFIFAVLPYKVLTVRVPPVLVIGRPVFIEMQIRLGFVHYHFIAVEQIVPMASGW